MNYSLRVAVIGIGEIAQKGHLPGFVKAGAQVSAVCSKSNPQLEKIAEQYQAQRAYRDWREMLEAGGFDAVSVCTPPFLHCDMAVESARKGYHVLVEKPMAITLAECDRMIKTADEAEVLLMVSHNQRFMAVHQIAKDIMVSGELGQPYLVHSVFGHPGPEIWSPKQEWYFKPELAGLGVMADLGYHKIDLMTWMTGQEVAEISAFTRTFEKQTTLEDTVVFALRFTGGALGTLHASWVFRGDWENSMTIRCERGVLRIPTEISDPVVVLKAKDGGEIVESTYRCSSTDPSGWHNTIQAFVRAIQNGEPSPVPGRDGKAAMAAVLSANKAASHKTVIRLNKHSPTNN